MKRYLSLLGQFTNYSIKGELEFRLNTFSYFIFGFIWAFLTYVITNVVYSQAGKVAGWTREEALLLVLVYYVTSTLIKNFVNPSMVELIEKIRKGELDFVLVKPVDSQFLVSVQKMHVLTSVRAIIMLGLLIYYIQKIGLHLSIPQVVIATILAMFGMLGMYALYFFLATLCIWLENIWNIDEIFSNALEMSKHPFQIYPSAIRNTLIYVIPVVGISSLPTVALLNRLDPVLAVSFILSMIVVFYLSRKFFQFALSKYTSASS